MSGWVFWEARWIRVTWKEVWMRREFLRWLYSFLLSGGMVEDEKSEASRVVIWFEFKEMLKYSMRLASWSGDSRGAVCFENLVLFENLRSCFVSTL
ncbi:hypothetical protein I7I48_11579 [Histoplasma ohiense]|nr:hypothetical protein I7I48_11579 [Histoplasma ohiense (nom. inval.)]